MKPQIVILSHLLLYSALALSLTKNVHLSLTNRADSESSNSLKNSTLDWSPCELDFGEAEKNEAQKAYDCARLTVPLDYTSASNGETIKLDLIKAKATKEPYKGSVLYNPGGPGGSGVDAILRRGEALLDVLGGQYDVIGFDTRLQRREFNTLPQADTWESVRTDGLKSATAFAEGCYESRQDTGRFIGTPFVARDMISIVDALDQGPKLNFWGTSYGTVLGQVTASIFPERIGRMLIDANLKADDYATTTWITGMRDTERALAHLLDECVEAGTDLCSLADYHVENTTGQSLLTALDELLNNYVNGGFQSESNASKSELNSAVIGFKRSIFADLYDPAKYPAIVSRIEGLFTGNETAMIPGEGTTLTTPWNIAGDCVNLGISCSDSSLRVEDPDDLFSIYQAHLAGGSFSETSVAGRLICAQWKFSAAEQIDTNKLRNVKTSFPILVVNSRYDPVTSLSGAWEVSARFRGSRVVAHEGVGHGLLNHPSNCTQEAVRRYFVDGELPELNTTCKPDMPVFKWAQQKIAKEEGNG
ncbi:unnamed protein product [Fusarium graminearum]|nr:unnamed protein product [Fusarium graminearum]